MEMVYMLVEVHRQHKPGHTMQYPSCYDAYEIQSRSIGPIVYDGGLGRGENTEECLICMVDVAYAKELEEDSNGRIRIISEQEADEWLKNNKQLAERNAEEQVTDPNRMLAIIAKCLASQVPKEVLSKEDMDALDPDSRVPGIRRKKNTAQEIFHAR